MKPATLEERAEDPGADNSRLEPALILVVVVVLSVVLLQSSATLATAVAYMSLVTVTLLVYYQYLTQDRFFLSLAFPVFVVLIIQILVYPLYIFLTANSRDYLFSTDPPEYAPAMALWLLAIVGFGWGVALRSSRNWSGGGRRGLESRYPSIPSLQSNQMLVVVTLPLILLSLLAAYSKFQAYGYSSLTEVADLGAFSADSIRRNRGLGPLTLVEMWSYVAVAYIGWHAYVQTRMRNRLLQISLGVGYALAGSALSLLNARRGVLFVHLGLLVLPFALKLLTRRRIVLFLIPIFLVSMFFVDRATSELRRIYYETSEVDVALAVSTIGEQGYAPLSFDHLELNAALLEQVQAGEFKPLLGRTFVAAALNWVPRSVFPGKPWTGGTYFSVAMGGAYSFDDAELSSGVTTGIIVETVMNVGVLGFAIVPIIMFGLGFVLSGIALGMFASRNSVVWLAAFSIYYWSAAGLFSDDMGGVVTKFVMNTSGLVLLYLLSTFVTRRSMSRPSVGHSDRSFP